MELSGTDNQIAYANDIIDGLVALDTTAPEKTGDHNTDRKAMNQLAVVETEQHHGRMLAALRDGGKNAMMAMRKDHPEHVTPRTNAIRQCMTEYQIDSNGQRGDKDKLDAKAIIDTFGATFKKLSA